jgi:multimeric flavodoxin WrbA
VVVNGSPRMARGNTGRVLAPFLDGMVEAGASVQLFYVKQLNVKPCMGEFHCWDKEPGVCLLKDGMQTLYPKLREADILVLATPVYSPLPGEMQNFINRLVPLIEPVLTWRDGGTRARFHNNVKIRKIVLVSACGWWEMGNFDRVIQIVEKTARDVGVEFAGAVLRPHAYVMLHNKRVAKKVVEALRKAGCELVKKGRISERLLKTIGQPLVPEEEYRKRQVEDYLKAKDEAED